MTYLCFFSFKEENKRQFNYLIWAENSNLPSLLSGFLRLRLACAKLNVFIFSLFKATH